MPPFCNQTRSLKAARLLAWSVALAACESSDRERLSKIETSQTTVDFAGHVFTTERDPAIDATAYADGSTQLLLGFSFVHQGDSYLLDAQLPLAFFESSTYHTTLVPHVGPRTGVDIRIRSPSGMTQNLTAGIVDLFLEKGQDGTEIRLRGAIQSSVSFTFSGPVHVHCLAPARDVPRSTAMHPEDSVAAEQPIFDFDFKSPQCQYIRSLFIRP